MTRISIVALLFIATSCSALLAQSRKTSTVSGFVYDKSTGETLIGATALLRGNSNGSVIHTGAFTNNNGYFVISGVPVGEDSITIYYAGYAQYSEQIKVGTSDVGPLRFYLTPSSYKVGEVIVTGNRTSAAQREFERPVSTLSMTEQQVNAIPKVVVADLLRALQSMPGIVPLSDFSSSIYVRGGTPDQNLYLIERRDLRPGPCVRYLFDFQYLRYQESRRLRRRLWSAIR